MQDTRGQDDGRHDSNMALALQTCFHGSGAYPLALIVPRKNPKSHPASSETCHETKQRVTDVTDAHIQDLRVTHRLGEQSSRLAAENPGHYKQRKILESIEDYNGLRKKLAAQKKSNDFVRSSSNLRKAECERLKKELLAALIYSGCHRFSSTQATSSLPTFKTSQLLNLL